jgi:sugar/nucleoside kinase (ribokinase family)
MTALATDVAGIGNAIVDVLAQADEALLAREGLAKGAMTLIDAQRAEQLYAAMGPAREVSGGSAANTLVGVAQLGCRAAFIGKVRNDQLGGIFRHDIRAAGVAFDTPPTTAGAPTARCLILVTPDAQRTMNTYLGACVELGPDDVDPAVVQGAKVTYLEGYLFDRPDAKQAFVRAAELAHAAGRKVALSLSDPFCVGRHKAEFRALVEGHVDLLFANQVEAQALTDTGDVAAAAAALAGKTEVAVITMSAAGALVQGGPDRHMIEAHPVRQLVDTTGAGDLFAAGFLAGYVRGKSLADCGHLGALAAAEVISHYGARPEADLKDLAARHFGPGFLA